LISYTVNTQGNHRRDRCADDRLMYSQRVVRCSCMN